MLPFLVTVAVYLKSTRAAPCVPAATCFRKSNNAESVKFACADFNGESLVRRSDYPDTADCSGTVQHQTLDFDTNGRGTLFEGVRVSGSSSGVVYTDYLQGANCPVLTDAASSCTDYIRFRRYGNPGYTNGTEQLPYQDIGRNCVNKGSQYTEHVMPKGCGVLIAGSNRWNCNSTHLWWTHWTNEDCTGTMETAQSDIFETNKCGFFYEYTHCDNGLTICPGDPTAVIDSWYYYFEIICGCGTTCSPSVTYTPAPTTSPISPTDAPTKAPSTTATPTSPPTTPAPTTPAPTSPSAAPTMSPSSSAPTTASPTSARPTMSPSDTPTTPAPTLPTLAVGSPTSSPSAVSTPVSSPTDATVTPSTTPTSFSVTETTDTGDAHVFPVVFGWIATFSVVVYFVFAV